MKTKLEYKDMDINNGQITLDDIMSYCDISYGNEQKIKDTISSLADDGIEINEEYFIKKSALLNFPLVVKIMYYDERLKKLLNNHYNNKTLKESAIGLYSYVRTIDVLAFGMKKIYLLSDETICYYINKYLINNCITELTESFISMPNDLFYPEYIIDLTEIFNKIFCDEIIEFLKSNKKYAKVEKFLSELQSNAASMWIVHTFVKKHGIIGIHKVLTMDKETQNKKLLEDIAKFIKTEFLKFSFKDLFPMISQ